MKKVPARIRRRPPAVGFTLIELVIATTIGAMLLVAVAEVAQLFGKDVEVVSEETDWRLDQCMVRLTDAAKHAWVVQEPEPDVLLLTDAMGHDTRYALDKDAHVLTVTRPSGSQGAVLQDVDDFTIETRSVTRYRETMPLDSYGVWWEQSVPGSAPGSGTGSATSSVTSAIFGGTPRAVAGSAAEAWPLEAGLPVALGFTLSTHAPDWVHTVDGVTEQTLGATLEDILIPLSFVPPVDERAVDGAPQDDTNSREICHIPPGQPRNSRSMRVPEESLSSHLAHGDVAGGCVRASGSTVDPARTVLMVELHEAHAPDDARPYGPRLGTISIPASALPRGEWSWMRKGDSEASTFGAGESGSTDVVCHIPPGSTTGAHTLHVSSNAVAAHLAHGDVIGSCVDASDEDSTQVLVYTPPVTGMHLDLSPFNARIEPGRAHTLVFRLAGPGAVLMAGHPVGTNHHTGIAAAYAPGDVFQPLDLSVPFSLAGMRSYSQTTAQQAVESLTVELRMLDGETRAASSSIDSQRAVEDPWLGCVPGEVPGLELAGP